MAVKGFVMKVDNPEKAAAIRELLSALSDTPEPEKIMMESPTLMAKEAFVAQLYEMGFCDACQRYIGGAHPVALKSASRKMLDEGPIPSASTYVAGTLAAAYLLEQLEAEAAKERADGYTIVEDSIPCACGCGKTVKALPGREGLVEVEITIDGRSVRLIALPPEGAKDLAEQLLDARGY